MVIVWFLSKDSVMRSTHQFFLLPNLIKTSAQASNYIHTHTNGLSRDVLMWVKLIIFETEITA